MTYLDIVYKLQSYSNLPKTIFHTCHYLDCMLMIFLLRYDDLADSISIVISLVTDFGIIFALLIKR